MTSISTSALTESIITLLTEAYDGPPDPSGTWFIDNERDSGILGILSRVTAAEASTSYDGSGDRGTTIAANAEHLRWSLANANGELRGQPIQGTWKTSWDMLTANEAEWERLRSAIRSEYEILCETIRQQETLEGEMLLGLLALLPHAAYHLGGIRQMVERVRAMKSQAP